MAYVKESHRNPLRSFSWDSFVDGVLLRQKSAAGRAWYLLALAVFRGGAVCLVFAILGVKGQVDAFQLVPLPQGGLISLRHNVGCVLYYEAPGAASGQFPFFNVTVPPASLAARAQGLQPCTADVTYSFGSRQGRAVLTLQVSHPGTFRVAVTGAPTVAGGSYLAFGSTIADGIVGIADCSPAHVLGSRAASPCSLSGSD
jgi:hypothetical protein